MNFKIKFSKWDTIVIAIFMIASLILSFFVYFVPKDTGNSVAIYVAGKSEISLNLENDKKITVNIYEGDYSPIKKINENDEECIYNGYFLHIENEMKIEIKDRKIRVSYSECPNQVCVNQGWVSIPNIPITCTHNRVVVVIESMEDSDVDIIL